MRQYGSKTAVVQLMVHQAVGVAQHATSVSVHADITTSPEMKTGAHATQGPRLPTMTVAAAQFPRCRHSLALERLRHAGMVAAAGGRGMATHVVLPRYSPAMQANIAQFTAARYGT